jgi:hypothetical protein
LYDFSGSEGKLDYLSDLCWLYPFCIPPPTLLTPLTTSDVDVDVDADVIAIVAPSPTLTHQCDE